MGEWDDMLGRGEYAQPTRAELIAENQRLRAELDSLRDRVTKLADRWEARAPDMEDDARDILLNHARRIRDEIGPDIPLPDQHVCDDYCHSCREPGEA